MLFASFSAIDKDKEIGEYVGNIEPGGDGRVQYMLARIEGVLEVAGIHTVDHPNQAKDQDDALSMKSLKEFLIHFYNELYNKIGGGKKSKKRRSKKRNKTKRNIRRRFF